MRFNKIGVCEGSSEADIARDRDRDKSGGWVRLNGVKE